MQTVRMAVGTAVSSCSHNITAVCLNLRGYGLEMHAEVVAAAEHALPPATADRTASVVSDALTRPSQIASLAAELAAAEAEVVREVVATASQSPSGRLPTPLVVGSGPPSIWLLVDEAPHAQIELSDPARLAETSELNVVDSFSARELAKGGQGGPIEPVAEWILLHDTKRNRVVVDLGPTVRMTYLPSGCEPTAAADIMASDIAPGSNLLDSLTQKLISGRHSLEPGGQLAIAGRCIEPLLEHLLRGPYFDAAPPRWSPTGAPIRWFLEESLRWSQKGTDEASSILCTVVHFIAESVARCLEQCVPRTPTPVQLLFAGGGEKNGLLLREVCRRLPPFDRADFPEALNTRSLLDAACLGVLAMLHIDQTPQTLPRITGIHTPRVLGRLTPGSPRNWQRLVQEMAATAPATMSLRCAI